jgi:hypothetical protein
LSREQRLQSVPKSERKGKVGYESDSAHEEDEMDVMRDEDGGEQRAVTRSSGRSRSPARTASSAPAAAPDSASGRTAAVAKAKQQDKAAGFKGLSSMAVRGSAVRAWAWPGHGKGMATCSRPCGV